MNLGRPQGSISSPRGESEYQRCEVQWREIESHRANEIYHACAKNEDFLTDSPVLTRPLPPRRIVQSTALLYPLENGVE